MFGGKRNRTNVFEGINYKSFPTIHTLTNISPHYQNSTKTTDLVGFTSWSSVREPSQVFTLLETVYNSFDAVAKRRQVFKVETVGDCYVAVGTYITSVHYLLHMGNHTRLIEENPTYRLSFLILTFTAGLPAPMKNHAVTMARFATDCLKKMDELVKMLEISLG